MGWLEFGLAWVAFCITHSLALRAAFRRGCSDRWGSVGLRAAAAASPAIVNPDSFAGALTRCVAGRVLYSGLIWLHPQLFDVSPLG